MNITHYLKKKLEGISGYWIYKRKHLPLGIDLERDLKQKFRLTDRDQMVIFDVGGNIGQSVQFFSKCFPQANIHSFEPFEETFLELQMSSKNKSNVVCNNIAIGDYNGTSQMKIHGQSQLNSLVALPSEKEVREIEIKVQTIEDYVKEAKVQHLDILKTDTEGFDLQVLKGAESLLKNKQISFILVETGFNPDYLRHTYLADIMNYLSSFGYFFKCIYDIHGTGESSFGNALFATK